VILGAPAKCPGRLAFVVYIFHFYAFIPPSNSNSHFGKNDEIQPKNGPTEMIPRQDPRKIPPAPFRFWNSLN
jgi:hypothetical protein